MLESEKQALQRLLEELLLEHRDLDDIIDRLQTSGSFDPLQLQRMKKRKLRLKDQISQ
ncbi:MAG TPA: YdcH family protein, partial [Gammaproteobacteria bacterium]|nr:YdcH family protein [Gammaproteobacteria bacterium]